MKMLDTEVTLEGAAIAAEVTATATVAPVTIGAAAVFENCCNGLATVLFRAATTGADEMALLMSEVTVEILFPRSPKTSTIVLINPVLSVSPFPLPLPPPCEVAVGLMLRVGETVGVALTTTKT